MNLSRECFDENLHFPMKVDELPSGETQITCPVVPNKTWIGPNLSMTLRKAQDDLREMTEKKEINHLPTCFTDGTFSGVLIRE